VDGLHDFVYFRCCEPSFFFSRRAKQRATSASYSYDCNGNRAGQVLNGTTYSLQLRQWRQTELPSVLAELRSKPTTYDGAGRTTAVTTSAGHDPFELPTSRTGSPASRIPVQRLISFTYNGLDTRVGKVDSTGTYNVQARRRRRHGIRSCQTVPSPTRPGISERKSSASTFDHADYLGTFRQADQLIADDHGHARFMTRSAILSSTNRNRRRAPSGSSAERDTRKTATAASSCSVIATTIPFHGTIPNERSGEKTVGTGSLYVDSTPTTETDPSGLLYYGIYSVVLRLPSRLLNKVEMASLTNPGGYQNENPGESKPRLPLVLSTVAGLFTT